MDRLKKTWRQLVRLLCGWYRERQRRKRAAWPAWRLAVNKRYIVCGTPVNRDDLPLMPALTAAQAMAMGEHIRRLRQGDTFRVLAKVKPASGQFPWWQVLVTSGEDAGREGLLNGVALLPSGRVQEQ